MSSLVCLLVAVKIHLALMNAMKYHYTDSENEKKSLWIHWKRERRRGGGLEGNRAKCKHELLLVTYWPLWYDMSEPLECLFKASLTQKGIKCQNLDLYILFFYILSQEPGANFYDGHKGWNILIIRHDDGMENCGMRIFFMNLIVKKFCRNYFMRKI